MHFTIRNLQINIEYNCFDNTCITAYLFDFDDDMIVFTSFLLYFYLEVEAKCTIHIDKTLKLFETYIIKNREIK